MGKGGHWSGVSHYLRADWPATTGVLCGVAGPKDGFLPYGHAWAVTCPKCMTARAEAERVGKWSR